MRLAAGLNKADYLGSLPCLFNAEEERFQQRFATLTMLNRPEPLSHSYYCRSMDMTGILTWQAVRNCGSACLRISLCFVGALEIAPHRKPTGIG